MLNIFLMILFIIFLTSLFVVKEGERGIMLRFGKVLRDSYNKPSVYFPGLHYKIPLIESVKILDSRIQTMNNQADRFVTNEKKDLIVDSYLKWHISDFSNYYLATGGGNISQAEVLLKRKFSDRLRSEIGKLNVKDIVTDARGRLMSNVKESLNVGTVRDNKDTNQLIESHQDIISLSNNSNFLKIKDNIFKKINQNSMTALGIEVIDVRIKQINLPTEVSDAIYQRMRAEREAVARRLRSQGQEEAEKLRASADYEVTHILAEAERQSRIIKGEGDAAVAKLFANYFSKDPEFYIFIRSLQAYKNSFKGNKDLLILNTDSSFFKYMTSSTIL